MRPSLRSFPLTALLALLLFAGAFAAAGPVRAQQPHVAEEALQALEWRMVGPFRGGRSTAVTGHPDHPDRYVMGTTGGGVWLTTDNGVTWEPISDGFFGGSIGAVDIADSDPNVIWAGEGSADIRGNTSMGRGVWKSLDAGRSWSFMGLPDAGQIGSLEIHPLDPDTVFVAALGHPFGPNEERGLYRTRDGGSTWERVLFVSERTGAMDVQFNLRNPREIYASMWTAERKPWTMMSGSEESGIWKSTDGGDSWVELTDPALDNGLPTGVMGKIGLAVSPANPDHVWALIEALDPDGGVWFSNDAGESWEKVNRDRSLRQRAWYYTHVTAHPTDPNTVYFINTRLYRSVDAGRTLEMIPVPHGDVHDLWINPERPERMAVADDGGAQITVNEGATWSTYYNQPTAELYDVAVDDGFPYYLYAGQQDNTGIGVPAWSDSNVLHPFMAWKNPGGCETGPIATTPGNPDVTYGGCYGGAISYVNQAASEYRDVLAYPQLQAGQAGQNLRYRFQWVSPILVSRHDPSVVYHAANHVLRTSDSGFSWEEISPDLTRDDPEHQDFAGGPIHHDITGVEIYGTIFALAESPHDADELWTGSDDGLIHVTRDGGETWTDVTPPGLPELATVDEIELSEHAPGRAIVAAQRYRLDDFAPYVFHTEDWGATWTRIADGANGIPDSHPVRTVREDPEVRGLLFAGTEYGVFVSFDDGGSWQSLQLNLPETPVTGLRVHRGDLAISTQGRSFWVLDDMTPLRDLARGVATLGNHLFAPRSAWRANMGGASNVVGVELEPAPQGATLHWLLDAETAAAAEDEPIELAILDASGDVIRSYTSAEVEGDPDPALPAESGLNRFVWDLQHEPPVAPEGVVIWGYGGGPKAVPGTYRVRLTAGDYRHDVPLELALDPRLEDVTDEQLARQLGLAIRIRDRMNEIYEAVGTVRSVRAQVEAALERAGIAGRRDAVDATAAEVLAELDRVEAMLVTVDAEGVQDLFNYQPQLASNYAQVYQHVTGPDGYIAGGPDRQPTAGAYERMQDLEPMWERARAALDAVIDEEVPALDAALREAGVGAIVVGVQ